MNIIGEYVEICIIGVLVVLNVERFRNFGYRCDEEGEQHWAENGSLRSSDFDSGSH